MSYGGKEEDRNGVGGKEAVVEGVCVGDGVDMRITALH